MLGLGLGLGLMLGLATNPRTVGAQVEVLQPEKGGLAGARYAAQVLAAGRGDGMVLGTEEARALTPLW